MPIQLKGFTLMELMIVMAIIAIASAAIIPRISNTDAKRYHVQLKTLTAKLNYNRRNAIVMNRPFTMHLFPLTQEDSELAMSSGQSSAKRQADWYSQGAVISWQQDQRLIKNRPFEVIFFPQGGATGGVIKLQQGSFIAHMKIDGISGKLSVLESKDESDD